MKKILLGISCAFLLGFSASAQVMSHSGIKNTVWTGFGSPFSGDFVYHGVIDTIQARVDVGQFTLEGMINWGAIANMTGDGNLDNFTFAITNRNPFYYHYNNENSRGNTNRNSTVIDGKPVRFDNSIKSDSLKIDPFYVNFLWHPFKNFDVGLGTKLNWKVGPAPGHGEWLWEDEAHVSQGGFSTTYNDIFISGDSYKFTPDKPGSADVVGFVHYANKYAKTAIGARYYLETDSFNVQFGAAIPNGVNTDNMFINTGAQFGFKKFNLAVAYEGLFQKDGNFYAGASFGVSQFYFDVYTAIDSIDFDNDDHDMSYSVGAAMTINIEKARVLIRPEGTFNWFEEGNYTPSWYAGATVSWGILKNLYLKGYTSFAAGSMDKRWKDSSNSDVKNYTGGFIYDVRPLIEFKLSDAHSFSAYVDLEWRTAFDGTVRNCWSTGAFWTYDFNASSKRKK